MSSPSYLLSLALLYICGLFALAWMVDRRSETRGTRGRRLVYALSLGVYCSSWTFYGAVGTATSSPWSHAPIYLGPILVFVLAWPLLRRFVRLGTQHRVTSIADYLGARFGKRQNLSMLVTLVATAAVLPYIALQFRALTQAWQIISAESAAITLAPADSGLALGLVLAVFTILFGARRLDGRERHQGMMSAVALESVVKLLAFVCVAVLAMLFLANEGSHVAVDWSRQSLSEVDLTADFFTRTLISACAILCLPRQFHVMVVEAPENADNRLSRWLPPAYLLLFMLLVIPISLAGSHVFGSVQSAAITPDGYVQWLPAMLGQHWISLIAFIGGISAATGMVIVATVSLAIMLTNEVAVPLMISSKSEAGVALLSLGNRLRRIRQFTIAGILLAAWIVSTRLYNIPWLSEIGFMSFLAAAQLAPGLLAGLYWRTAHGTAITAGLLVGILLWFICLVLPAVLPAKSALLTNGFLGVGWLRPQALFGFEGPGPLSYAALWSLGCNVLLVLLLSRVLQPSAADRRQAAVFMDADTVDHSGDDFSLSPLRAGQLRALLPPFLEEARLAQLWRSFEERYQQRLLPADRVPLFALREAESALAGVIGTASASRVIGELTDNRQLDFANLATLVSDAGRQQTFNRELLETTIESLQQGVAVIDAELRLVAWNTRYEQMFAYPERLLYVGMPIARLYRFNAERGILGVGSQDIHEEVEKRLDWLRQGHPHRLERQLPDGRVFDIHGVPMPRGGFVTTYIDITDYREMVTQLEEVRLELEGRVASGSESLADANAELRQENRLRAEAESKLREANLSKSRFMSATSHDLLQPINAARLFVASLAATPQQPPDTAATVGKIDQALARAERLISELREIARLDSGTQQLQESAFSVDALLRELYAEFSPMAQSRGLELRLSSSSLWLQTDRNLLYRALQNLVSNALKYSRQGAVLIGVRRRPGTAEIQVIDQGPGIPEADRSRVFAEFERLSSAGGQEGLGLGLALVSRYAALLRLQLQLDSEPGRGSRFSLCVPRGQPRVEAPGAARQSAAGGRLAGSRVLCIDNDASVRDALEAMLSAEGCTVITVADRKELREALPGFRPDVVVADYHLDDGDTGIEALRWALRGADRNVPCIIVSADDGNTVRGLAREAGYRSLPKPVNPARLSALIFALIAERA